MKDTFPRVTCAGKIQGTAVCGYGPLYQIDSDQICLLLMGREGCNSEWKLIDIMCSTAKQQVDIEL